MHSSNYTLFTALHTHICTYFCCRKHFFLYIRERSVRVYMYFPASTTNCLIWIPRDRHSVWCLDVGKVPLPSSLLMVELNATKFLKIRKLFLFEISSPWRVICIFSSGKYKIVKLCNATRCWIRWIQKLHIQQPRVIFAKLNDHISLWCSRFSIFAL